MWLVVLAGSGGKTALDRILTCERRGEWGTGGTGVSPGFVATIAHGTGLR